MNIDTFLKYEINLSDLAILLVVAFLGGLFIGFLLGVWAVPDTTVIIKDIPAETLPGIVVP